MSTFVDSDGTETAGPREPKAALAAEIDKVARDLDAADASEIISWAVGRFGDDLVVATSFQDVVLVDLAVKVKPDVTILFLDTGFHFPETLSYMAEVKARYSLNLEVAEPGIGLDEWPCGSARCCEFRKVLPLQRALGGRSAWITGLKRIDTPERANAPVVDWDKGLVKVNPMAAWTDDDVDRYVEAHGLPRHPLNAKGYVSIGCAPTTRPIAEGENPRNGRWPDSEKTECGLHI